jgi:hypothetical protein
VEGTFAGHRRAPERSCVEQVAQRYDESPAGDAPATITDLAGVARPRLAVAVREPVTVAELQAALRAAWAGQFRTDSGRGSTRARRPQAQAGIALPGRVVMVVGCHGGAGASTLALAVAQAALESGRSARLLDCASPRRSGLLTAVDAELGLDGSGWRRGRRARLPIERVCDALASATDVPAPPQQPPGGVEFTVVDAGWGAADVLTGDSWLAQEAGSAVVVLVARATIPALRQLEHGLATCPGDPFVAVLGPTRWARSVHATAGRLLDTAQAAGRVVRVPLDRHLSATGITCAPLPKAVVQAGRQIVTRVLVAGPYPLPAQNRPPGTSPTRAVVTPAVVTPAVVTPAVVTPAVVTPAVVTPAVASRAVASPDEMDRGHDHRTD